MSLLQMSVSGAVMILTVIVIRALAFYKLPKRTFPILWYIVLARLLIPYTLPCAVSVYSLLNGTQAAESQEPLPNAEFTAVSSDAVFIVPSEGTAENIPVSFIDNASAPPIDIRTAVWLAGILGFAAFFTVSYIKCRKTFSESLPADNDFTRNWLENHRLFRRVSIRYSDRITAPLTYGVFRPVILMPKNTDWTNANDLKYVMAHEYVHIRRFDAVFKLTLTAALCVHWFNPLVWAMFFIANKDIELSCDEAVIRMFGENSKSAYAMALIHMEEKKSGFFPLGVNFGKNSVEERIVTIMKYKKLTIVTLAAAVCLVVGTTTAFATSAVPKDKPDNSQNESASIKNSAPLSRGEVNNDSQNEDALLSGEETDNNSNVTWWTYDEYAEWLEQEKKDLQSIIGSKAWTPSRGDFVWDQALVDETIAMYEGILENIKNGMLYSKSVDGSEDVMLAQGISESPVTSHDFDEYAKYGLKWDGEKNILYYNGKRVRYFLDGADMGNDGMAIKIEYADSEKKGDIDVHAVRQRVENGDGSFNLMGPLTGLEPYSQKEFDERKFVPATLSAAVFEDTVAEGAGDSGVKNVPVSVTEVYNDTIEEATAEGSGDNGGKTFQEIFAKYKNYDITYVEAKGESGKGNVYYNGQLVHKFVENSPDGVFSFTSSKEGGINVRVEYKNGEPEVYWWQP